MLLTQPAKLAMDKLAVEWQVAVERQVDMDKLAVERQAMAVERVPMATSNVVWFAPLQVPHVLR